MVKNISGKAFKETVLSNNGLCVVKFKTELNVSCLRAAPVFMNLAAAYAGVADFYSVDLGHSAGLDHDYGIMVLPTILFFKNGRVIDQVVGLGGMNELAEKIEAAVATII